MEDITDARWVSIGFRFAFGAVFGVMMAFLTMGLLFVAIVSLFIGHTVLDYLP